MIETIDEISLVVNNFYHETGEYPIRIYLGKEEFLACQIYLGTTQGMGIVQVSGEMDEKMRYMDIEVFRVREKTHLFVA
jgi:hypothetical protein